jgi:hypothetical protein
MKSTIVSDRPVAKPACRTLFGRGTISSAQFSFPRRSVVLTALIWPILISTIVLFFASFLSWMVLGLHKKDWLKLPKEDEFMAAVKKCDPPVGSFMFPNCETAAERQSPEFQAKYMAGPRGVMTVLSPVNMGQNLGMTMAYFFVVSTGLACLASMAFSPGADFLTVFRFVFLAGLMTFLAAIVAHAIWFRPRIVGQVIESVAYAALTATIFAALWPAT